MNFSSPKVGMSDLLYLDATLQRDRSHNFDCNGRGKFLYGRRIRRGWRYFFSQEAPISVRSELPFLTYLTQATLGQLALDRSYPKKSAWQTRCQCMQIVAAEAPTSATQFGRKSIHTIPRHAFDERGSVELTPLRQGNRGQRFTVPEVQTMND